MKYDNAYWIKELEASAKMMERMHTQGDKVVQRFLDQRDSDTDESSAVNLFWANVSTLMSTLFARLPRVDVKRRFDDYEDDIARNAARVMERLLNSDLEENGQEYEAVLKACLQDRVLPGLGVARLCYDCEQEEQEYDEVTYDEMGQPTVETRQQTVTLDEWVDVVYYHWRDVAWSWGRTFADLRWFAFRNYMSKADFRARFPEVEIAQVEFSRRGVSTDASNDTSAHDKELTETACVWEIWCKDSQQVYFHTPGPEELLDERPDPYGLKGFWPMPPPMLANATTSLFLPKADYTFAQDLYEDVNILQERIKQLVKGAKLVGVYDAKQKGIKRMLSEGAENELIPVENWAMFGEKGGVRGVIDWFPLEVVVEALANLRQQRDESLTLLDQVTGYTDILMGSGTNPREGVGTQELKASFGSVRIQSLQQQFGTFATDIMQLKAEMIARLCEPEKIAKMANIQFMDPADQPSAQQALQLIKDWDNFPVRIQIQSETMAMVDYNRIKAERNDVLMGTAQFMQSAGPLLEQFPESAPMLMQMLKWFVAGHKGSDDIEGVLDQAIKAASQQQGQKKPDEAAQREQMKAQAEMQKIQAKLQGDMQLEQMKQQGDMRATEAKLRAQLKVIEAKAMADGLKEETQALFAELEREMDAIFTIEESLVASELKKEEINAQISAAAKRTNG